MKNRVIVVCDQDTAFAESVAQITPAHLEVRAASNFTQAQHLIMDCQIQIAHLCISTNISKPAGIPLVKFCKSNRPVTPISIICEEKEAAPFSEVELGALHIQNLIQKPIKLDALLDKIFPSAAFNLGEDLASIKRDLNLVGETAELEAGEMHPIEAASFLGGSKSFFDVYIKIKSNKFIKILHAQDAFDSARVESYLKKGVTHLYIKRDAQALYLRYCDTITGMLLDRKDVSLPTKTLHVSSLGKETYDHLQIAGVSELSLAAAKRFVDHSQKLLKQLPLESDTELKSLVNDLAKSEHAVGTVIILGVILSAKEYTDENVLSVLSLGGFLHDLGLLYLPERLRSPLELELSAEDLALYEWHPVLGYEKFSAIPGINPMVGQVILQHHERPNRKGYPKKIGAGLIAPASELVGIADLYHHLLSENTTNEANYPLEQMEKKYFNDFSFQTIDAFRVAFFMKK
jgi:HD-GYP domain-containing protein (c-di-GMP phosphodiesterase class II)